MSNWQWATGPEDVAERIARAIRKCVGNDLGKTFGDVLNEPLPPRIAELVRRLDPV